MESDILIDKSTQDSRLRCALALIEKGEICFNAGNLDKAYEAFILGTELYPEYARAKKNLGIIFWKKGEIELAYKYLSEALKLDPDDPSIVLSYGDFLERNSRIYLAEGLYEIYLAKKYNLQIAQSLTRLKQSGRKKSLGNNSQIKGTRNKKVIFISDMAPYIPRVPKFAYGLKRAGWDVVLLHQNELTFSPEKYFVETRQYRTPKEAADLAASYRSSVCHVFSAWSFDTAAAVIQRRFGNIVFDDYDVMAGMVKKQNIPPGQLELERYCLENADGLCCRSLEIQHAKHYLGYKYRGKILYLLDCCWANGIKKLPKKTGSVHIAYCGNMSPRQKDPYNYHYDASLLLSKNHIHYHIYHNYQDTVDKLRGRLEKYVYENGGNPSFIHVYDPLPCDELITELSAYHYGMHIMWPKPGDEINFPYFQRGFYYGSSNKIFDYIDAGLSVLIHGGALQKSIVTRYGNGKLINNFSDIVMNNIPKQSSIPKAYDIELNIMRLINFYKNL